MNEYLTVGRPDGTPYCTFEVDELTFNIKFLEGTNLCGYSVSLDRKVIPDLKKFLDSLNSSSENLLEPVIRKNS